MILVSLFDVKAATFNHSVHLTENKATALRDFSQVVNSDHGGMLASNPADFELWKVGEFYPDNHDKPLVSVPELLATGTDVKVAKE